MPLVFGAGGLGLLVYGCIAGLNASPSALAAASLVAVMCARCSPSATTSRMLRASRDEALTDALTGLGNRRALARELERELPRASGRPRWCSSSSTSTASSTTTTPSAIPAGDALLVRLGAGLAASSRAAAPPSAWAATSSARCSRPGTRGRDAAGRQRGRGALRARRRLRHRLLLRRDPPARRGGRRRRRAADRRPAHVRAEERRPHLGHAPVQGRAAARPRRAQARPRPRHHRRHRRPGRGHRARAAASLEEVEQIRHATELRDVGKVAMPDAILAKPGPLDDDEWAFIRRHTIIGERIVAAAPALTPRGGLVRASHERWDGAGYPDALAGDAIPLGARDRRRRRRLRGDDGCALRVRRSAGGGARRARGLRGHAVRSPVVAAFASRCATAGRRRGLTRDIVGFARRPRKPSAFRYAESIFCLTEGKSGASFHAVGRRAGTGASQNRERESHRGSALRRPLRRSHARSSCWGSCPQRPPS